MQCFLTLGDFEATKTDVVRAGTTVFYRMYGGKPDETLDTLRKLQSMEYITTSKVQLQPERLPPTERAAYFHFLRVHLQIVIWKYLGRVQIDPRYLGWEVKGSMFSPIVTDLEPAPEELLRIVRCKCKLLPKRPCNSNICSCRKNGLTCVTTACCNCRGTECYNPD